MNQSIAYQLITMCFTNLIQILPTQKDLNSPRITFINTHINTPSHITTVTTSKHTYTSKQLWAIYDHAKPASLVNLPFWINSKN